MQRWQRICVDSVNPVSEAVAAALGHQVGELADPFGDGAQLWAGCQCRGQLVGLIEAEVSGSVISHRVRWRAWVPAGAPGRDAGVAVMYRGGVGGIAGRSERCR